MFYRKNSHLHVRILIFYDKYELKLLCDLNIPCAYDINVLDRIRCCMQMTIRYSK